MKSASVYYWSDRFYFCSKSQSVAGVWIASSPYFKIESQSALEELHNAAIAVLNASRGPVPHPEREDLSSIGAGLLELAGVRTWTAFMKETISVLGLRADENVLRIVPHRDARPKGGFQELPPDNAIEVSLDCSAAEFATAFEEALARCE
jgi:hypothetical protein